MIEVIYKWDNIKIIVPAPSCISCVNCGPTSIDENSCVCMPTQKNHSLTDKCDDFRLDVIRQDFGIEE